MSPATAVEGISRIERGMTREHAAVVAPVPKVTLKAELEIPA